MGCQKGIARKIVEADADYLLAVKENQPTLHRKVKALMDEAMLENYAGMAHDHFEEVDGGHGRIEKRRLWCTPEVHWVKKAKAQSARAILPPPCCVTDEHRADVFWETRCRVFL